MAQLPSGLKSGKQDVQVVVTNNDGEVWFETKFSHTGTGAEITQLVETWKQKPGTKEVRVFDKHMKTMLMEYKATSVPVPSEDTSGNNTQQVGSKNKS